MKVKKLINILQDFPPDASIFLVQVQEDGSDKFEPLDSWSHDSVDLDTNEVGMTREEFEDLDKDDQEELSGLVKIIENDKNSRDCIVLWP